MTKPQFWYSLNSLSYHPHQFYKAIEHARVAERLGFDAIDIPEHVLFGASDDGEHGQDDGTFTSVLDLRRTSPKHTPRNSPWIEGLSALAVLAGATERIGLVTAANIAPLRPAGLLAKQAATISQLSRGRFALGVAASWNSAEYAALGVDFVTRGQRLTDTIGALRSLWRDSPASYFSETVSFDRIFCEPKPYQGQELPIYVAGPAHKRTFQRIAEHGNGWLAWLRTPDYHAASISRIKEAVADAGRDPEALTFVIDVIWLDKDGRETSHVGRADVRRSMECVAPYLEAGMTAFKWQSITFTDTVDEIPDFLTEVAGVRQELGYGPEA